MNKKIPFYSNSKDNLRCFQATLRSVLKYYYPNKEYSFEKLDKLTGRKKGLGTWPTKSFVDIQKFGLKVKEKGLFDYERFVNEGVGYLRDMYGEEFAQYQAKISDIPYEQKMAKRFLKTVKYEKLLPSLDEIKKLIDNDWLVLVNLNYYSLYKKKGFSGHLVLVLDVYKNSVEIHDPGLPPRPNQVVDKEDFLAAWSYPSDKSRNYAAFKKNN